MFGLLYLDDSECEFQLCKKLVDYPALQHATLGSITNLSAEKELAVHFEVGGPNSSNSNDRKKRNMKNKTTIIK